MRELEKNVSEKGLLNTEDDEEGKKRECSPVRQSDGDGFESEKIVVQE